MGSAQGPRGFTLLELLVVMVLAGILLSIVTISVSPDPRQSLAREARRVGELFALAADEARIRQQPIVWEADTRGYRFVAEVGGERQLLTGDDLLRERQWERPLTRLAVIEPGARQPVQVVLGPGAPPARVPVAREWVQPRFRLELANDLAQVAVEFDETGRGALASH
ncbi:MAG: prepilin-type N-terminal cleavage/methylation domain-containing protein [Burkholderiaceae bacterium]|nr:prepilin-type N-terminal cleavage/methylation domain-containing protein [Burkholderiaceae bacterium]MCX8004445.1 prepilin-type N-terminal cleavage/methylation domain-containing protein [Burkholderiaceae bacterium]